MKNTQAGFFLLEVVIASAVIATILVLLLGSIRNSVEVSQRSLERTQAAYLLEEGVEAMKAIRNQSTGWTTISGLTNGTIYYLSWSGSMWSLSTTPSTIGSFTRTVVVAAVQRDADDDIAASGTTDTGTKKVTVSVTWTTPSETKVETLSFYISDING